MNSPKMVEKMSEKPLKPAFAEGVAAAAILERGLAEAIVSGALLRVLEDIIGLADRLEARLLVAAAVMTVGMAFLGETAVGGLDRGLVRAPLDAQQIVIIALSHANIPTQPFGPDLIRVVEALPLSCLSERQPFDRLRANGFTNRYPLFSSSTSENSASTTSSSGDACSPASPGPASAPGSA